MTETTDHPTDRLLSTTIGAVVIGRNEGERLKRCLSALQGRIQCVVYVDSGSTDGSIDEARARGAEVVELDIARPFTAARARNAGVTRLLALYPDSTAVQFLDGDCEMREEWLAAAHSELTSEPDIAMVCGRRREKYPEATIWNRFIDAEWDTPIGDAMACGGDSLARLDALGEVGGFRDSMIAGEEPEMCYRLRQKGWRIRRIDAEMVWHDAAMTRFSQWWKRARRAGHAYAEGAWLHGSEPERYERQRVRRAMVWGGVLPVATLCLAVIHPAALAIGLVYPAQVLRLHLRGESWENAALLTLAKLPEALGVLEFHWRRVMRRDARIIEYK